MKCFVAVMGLLALAQANPGLEFANYHYANPAGVTYRGTGLTPGFAVSYFLVKNLDQKDQMKYEVSYMYMYI